MVPATGCASARSRRSRFLEAATREASDVTEISPGWNRYWLAMCPNYRSADFPAFEICVPCRLDHHRVGRSTDGFEMRLFLSVPNLDPEIVFGGVHHLGVRLVPAARKAIRDRRA